MIVVAVVLVALPPVAGFGAVGSAAVLSARTRHGCTLPVPRRGVPRHSVTQTACASLTDPALLVAAARVAGAAFEAQPPPLGTSVAVLGSTAGVMGYWWLVLVPSERRDLAKNKNKGGLNDYLDDLEKTAVSERKLEKWFYAEWLERRARVQRIASANATKRMAAAQATADGQAATATAIATEADASDIEAAQDAQELAKAREREIENAIPMPSFFSLDNPIIIALALALFGAAFGGLGR